MTWRSSTAPPPAPGPPPRKNPALLQGPLAPSCCRRRRPACCRRPRTGRQPARGAGAAAASRPPGTRAADTTGGRGQGPQVGRFKERCRDPFRPSDGAQGGQRTCCFSSCLSSSLCPACSPASPPRARASRPYHSARCAFSLASSTAPPESAGTRDGVTVNQTSFNPA